MRRSQKSLKPVRRTNDESDIILVMDGAANEIRLIWRLCRDSALAYGGSLKLRPIGNRLPSKPTEELFSDGFKWNPFSGAGEDCSPGYRLDRLFREPARCDLGPASEGFAAGARAVDRRNTRLVTSSY